MVNNNINLNIYDHIDLPVSSLLVFCIPNLYVLYSLYIFNPCSCSLLFSVLLSFSNLALFSNLC